MVTEIAPEPGVHFNPGGPGGDVLTKSGELFIKEAISRALRPHLAKDGEPTGNENVTVEDWDFRDMEVRRDPSLN